MNNNFDFYKYIHSNFSSPLSILINHEGKTKAVNEYLKKIHVIYSIPILLGLTQVYCLSKKYSTKLSNNLGILKYSSLGCAIIIHCLFRNQLIRKLEFYDFAFPLPTKAQEEFTKSNNIANNKI